jgi:hypothetical protein
MNIISGFPDYNKRAEQNRQRELCYRPRKNGASLIVIIKNHGFLPWARGAVPLLGDQYVERPQGLQLHISIDGTLV